MSGDPPAVIVVMGVSGAGKTTIAKLLAERLGWEFADGDQFHPPANVEKMRSGVPLTKTVSLGSNKSRNGSMGFDATTAKPSSRSQSSSAAIATSSSANGPTCASSSLKAPAT